MKEAKETELKKNLDDEDEAEHHPPLLEEDEVEGDTDGRVHFLSPPPLCVFAASI